MTREQAKTLRAAVHRLVAAEIAASWKGAASPDEMDAIERDLREARKEFNKQMDECVQPAPSSVWNAAMLHKQGD